MKLTKVAAANLGVVARTLASQCENYAESYNDMTAPERTEAAGGIRRMFLACKNSGASLRNVRNGK